MPAGRRRKTLPWQVRLQRCAALTAPVLAAAVVVPVASALESSGQVVTTTSLGPGGAGSRSTQGRASRDLVRPEPPAPTMAEVDGRGVATVPTALAAASAGAAAGSARAKAAAPLAAGFLTSTGPTAPAAQDPTGTAPAAQDPAGTAPAAQDTSPRWVTTGLNVRTGADEGSRLITVVEAGSKIAVTGVEDGAWAQVVLDGRLAWVHKEYLARDKPAAEGSNAPVSGSSCPDGSSVESGLTSNAIAVYRAVCAAFPSVSSWGGRSGSGGNHSAGLALDIMVTGSAGDAIAAYVRANAGRLGVSEVIFSQRIWTVQRGSEGWRFMSDRGSTTANHYDHVHVSVY